MIVFSDLHLCEKTADTVFDEVFPILEKAVLVDPEKRIICLGDFYHIRYTINVGLQNRVYDLLDKWISKGIRIEMIPGNHDQINEKGDNALTILAWNDGNYHGIYVYDKPTIDYNFMGGTYLPYRKNSKEIFDFLEKNKVNIVYPIFMHQGIQGATMNNGFRDENGMLLPNWVNGLTLSGHYHKAQQLSNVYYVGSPYQIDRGESNENKCYLKYAEGRLTAVPLSCGPRYYKLENTPPGTTINAKKGDEVRIKAPSGIDIVSYRKSFVIPEGVELIIEQDSEEYVNRLNLDKSATLEDYAKSYVDEFSGDLDKNVLMSVYREIINE